MSGRCAACGDVIEHVRRDCEAYTIIDHYRCQGACRGGGHVVRDRVTGERMTRGGPVFG